MSDYNYFTTSQTTTQGIPNDYQNREYIDRQNRILNKQNQKNMGKIPKNIYKTHHADLIQNIRFNTGFTEKQHVSDSYDQYYDYLDKKGLLNENFKTRINTIYVNVDSRHRTQNPKAVLINERILENNPLSFSKQSVNVGLTLTNQNFLAIYCPNHNIQKNTRISLSGVPYKVNTVKAKIIIYDENTEITDDGVFPIIFTKGSTSVAIKCILGNYSIDQMFSVPGITYSALQKYDTSDMYVTISGFETTSSGSQYFGNIPINFLNATHRIYLTNPNTVTSGNTITNSPDILINVPGYVDSNLIVDTINGFYINLNAPYDGQSITEDYIITLTINHIGGIPINKLNAEFPIDTEHLQGYHIVNYVDQNNLYVIMNKEAYFSSSGNVVSFGGSNIIISEIQSIENGFVNPNNYKIKLPSVISNIIEAKLLNSIFPKSYKVISNYLNKNNKLYWQNQDDGNNIYFIELTAGNGKNLQKEIEDKIYNVKKISNVANSKYTNNNIIKVDINTDTNIVSFRSYNEAILSRPIQSIDPQISDTSSGSEKYTLTILHPYHFLNVGDSILFSNFVSTLGISADILNTTHVITSVLTSDVYMISISGVNLSNDRTDTGGGFNAKIYAPNSFRMLFNYPDTMGNILGFRNVGDDSSITKFNTVIKNSDEYQNETVMIDENNLKFVFDKSGNKILLEPNLLKFNGDDYIYLSISELDNIVVSSNNRILNKVFSKIMLNVDTGSIAYNSFTNTDAIYYEPLDLHELTVSLRSKDGDFYDCDGANHSFMIQFTCLDYIPEDTAIDSTVSAF